MGHRMTEIAAVAEDMGRASLALARRFNSGATMWCTSPSWPFHASHVAVEFVHPVIVTVPIGADVVATLRANVRPGDIVVALAGSDDPQVGDAMRRGEAWGVETVWIGAGSDRPTSGAADHVIWLDTNDPLEASECFVRIYHLLWELTHVVFEHPGLLKDDAAAAVCTEEVCITCSDEGRLTEVVAVDGDEAVVRALGVEERIDVSLIDPPQPGDLVLVHAGFAIR